MEYTKLEQLTVGTTFVEYLQEIGFISYVVIENDGDSANMESVSRPNYGFKLTQEDIDLRIEFGVLPLYDTRGTAKRDVLIRNNG